MRFALTSLDLETITPHAGRCRSFLVYEGEAGTEPVKVKDLFLAEDQIFHVFEGEGAHPLDEVTVVITGNAREKFIRKCANRGIQAVLTSETDPVAAVKGYFAGTLSAPAPLPERCDHDH
ncbi:nitrogenase accessory factor [Skermanella rosea]|uniref:NifB/NifX family molybdenum-iron cluster-binding protein n=1 Tax=Skermanella rosea TaxID=1817965 RepID=UPI001932BA11|nr:nitrogenase accessory factor [Skermanella rosea]UEM01178.1 nitrogenase accessory factor [Skermanella rosea]